MFWFFFILNKIKNRLSWTSVGAKTFFYDSNDDETCYFHPRCSETHASVL